MTPQQQNNVKNGLVHLGAFLFSQLLTEYMGWLDPVNKAGFMLVTGLAVETARHVVAEARKPADAPKQ